MALGIPSNKTSPRCYTIVELLGMRHTLLYVSFPVKNFKPEVWNEMVLTDAVITLTLSVCLSLIRAGISTQQHSQMSLVSFLGILLTSSAHRLRLRWTQTGFIWAVDISFLKTRRDSLQEGSWSSRWTSEGENQRGKH